MTTEPEVDLEPDWLAIEFIRQGSSMKLSPVDLPEAVRILAPTLTTGQIAKRCGCKDHVVTRIAKRLGVKTKPAQIRSRPPRQSVAA